MADQGKSTCSQSAEQLLVTFQDENVTSSECHENGYEFSVERPSNTEGSLNENTADVTQAVMTSALQYPSSVRDVTETSVLPCSSISLSLSTSTTSDSDRWFTEALKNRYRRTKAITPVILDNMEGPADSKKDYFVDLQIEERDLLGLSSSQKEVTLRELFYTESKEGRRNKRTILITGDAGFGKTTLARKLCYDWSSPGDNYLSNFDLVLDIPLLTTRSLSIKNSVLNEIYLNTGYMIPDDSVLEDMNVLYILDGLDEADGTDVVISFLDEHLDRLHSNSAKGRWSVIVTSRPYAVEKCQRLLCLFDRRLAVAGFSTDNQEKYIHTTLQEDSAKDLIECVKKDSFLSSVSKSPLMLHLICCVRRKDGTASISCRTELYLQILKLRIDVYAAKHGRKDIDVRFGEISSIKEDRLFVQLGEVANKYLLNKEGRITKESLIEQFKYEFEFVIGLGVLVAVHTLSNMKPITIYEFTHFTFAELLSAIYVADKVGRSELSLDTKFSEVLETGFFVGVLGSRVVEIDVVSSWISRLGLTLPKLYHIKNEAHLDGESWKSFCSSIKRISFDCFSSDMGLLESTDLPNLQEIIITCIPLISTGAELELIFEASKIFLLKFESCELLRIGIALKVIYLSFNKENDGFRLINMEGVMTNLINLANNMRSRSPVFTICVQILARNNDFIDASDLSSQSESFFGSFNKNPIGILPDVLPNSAGPYGQWLYFTWKIDNIEIRYYITTEDDYVRKLAVPIIEVTPEEYNTISKEPFLHQSSLKVEGFKRSRRGSACGNLKIPTTLGHVDCSTFLERLKKFRKETRSSQSEKEGITSGDTAESFYFSLLKKKYQGLTGKSLEDSLDSFDFSYLTDRFYGIDERKVHPSETEGFRIVETSHFTFPTSPKENSCVIS